MTMRVRHWVLVLASACVLATARPESAAPPDRTPRLIVLLMVDQMRADYVDRFQHQWTRGFRRLLTEGAWFRRVSYPYANTVTCAGHASVSTGATPATHGILLNSWWERAQGRAVTCTEDPSVRNLGYSATLTGGDSVAALRTPTLADELRAQLQPAGRAASFSLKARAAAMLGGHRPDAVAWFDDSGSWATSTAFAATLVPEVADFVRRNPVDRDAGKTWTRLLPAGAYLFEDPAVGITPPEGMTPRFPHALSSAGSGADAAFYDRWQSSPYSDEYLGRMALDIAHHLHFERGSTNLLAISFSALDKVGHDYGPQSHEVQDILARLDRTLGDLFAGLDDLVGAGQYVVALTADHGVAPLPERTLEQGISAGRIDTTKIVEAIEAPLARRLGPGPHVAGFVHTDAYLTPAAAGALSSPELVAELKRSVRAVSGVADVLTSAELRSADADRPLVRRLAASHVEGRSGDLTLLYQPYWLDDRTGTGHGTPYDYDARVPVFLMGKGIAGGEYLREASPTDIAPTLALLAGVTLAHADGRPLVEALKTDAAAPGVPRPASR